MASISCAINSFSINRLFLGFNQNCMLSANLIFYSNDTNSIENDPALVGHIDESNTVWGTALSCDYAIFQPLLEMIFATIWLIIFAVCGHGGQGTDDMFSNPWRIVFPAAIFFVIMTITTLTHYSLVSYQLAQLCGQLKMIILDVSPNTRDTDCAFLMQTFSLNVTVPQEIFVAPTYTIVNISSVLKVLAWVAAFLIMALRIVFAVDFQLVRVTIGTLNIDDSERSSRESTFVADNILTTTMSTTSSAANRSRTPPPTIHLDKHDNTMMMGMTNRKSRRYYNLPSSASAQ